MLKNTPHLALSSEAAIQLITGNVDYHDAHNQQQGSILIPKSERMTREEAKQFLRDCHDAAVVIISPDPKLSEGKSSNKKQQLVITEPFPVLKGYEHSAELDFVTQACYWFKTVRDERAYANHIQSKPHKNLLQKETSSSESLEQSKNNNHHHSKCAAAAVLATDADEVVVAAQKAHSRFWAWISLGLSLQMLVFAYWTFIEYSWDVMEPFTYFVSCFYMILFFSYFVRTKRGYSFGEMDKIVLSRAVRNKLVIRKTA